MKVKIPYKSLILAGLIILLNLIFLPEFGGKRFNFREGEIATEDVIAPYDFFIPKSEQELMQEKNEIAQRLPPIYNYDAEVVRIYENAMNRLETIIDTMKGKYGTDTIVSFLQREYGLPKDVINYLIRNNYKYTLKRLYREVSFYLSKGIISSKNLPYRILIIVRGNKETVVSIDEIYSVAEVESLLGANASHEYRQLIRFFTKPNVNFDEEQTNKRIEEVFANVKKTKGEVLKGELIIEKHKKISSEALEKLAALEKTYDSIGMWQILKTLFLRNLFYFSILGLLILYGKYTNLNFMENKNFIFTIVLFAVYIIIGKMAHAANLIYLLPVSFFIFLFSLYFNASVGFFFAFLFSAIFGILLVSLPVFVYLLVSGTVAVLAVHTIKSRFLLFKPLLYVAIANTIAILFIESYFLRSGINLMAFGTGILNSFISIVALTIFLPLFERLFDFTTDFTLLELGNLNLPIFKEMSVRAPGTYHHSVIVGNLAEAGATAINADPVLARVGAYYHDIGKLKKPEYFIENQIGQKNPHDNLKPQMSALVIISHVKEGYEMGREMKLPKNLLAIISEHHGTSRIESFYRKSLHSTEKISEDVFTYPGPKPKTREAALVMLADSVEATARAEKNITVAKLQKILKDNFDKKFNEGQLDECPINRVDLEQIKTAFLPILMGIFHPRIDYEEQGENLTDKHI